MRRPEYGADPKIKRVVPVGAGYLLRGALAAWDMKNGELAVPLDPSQRGRALRLHEMLHVKFTRKHHRGWSKVPHIDGLIEDVRIHNAAKMDGRIDLRELEGWSQTEVQKMMEGIDPKLLREPAMQYQIVLHCLRAFLRPVDIMCMFRNRGMEKGAAANVYDLADQIDTALWKSQAALRRLAKKLDSVLFPPRPVDPEEPHPVKENDDWDEGDVWMPMIIGQASLTDTVRNAMTVARRKHLRFGKLQDMRDFARGRPFGSRKQLPRSGAMLIDISGSMKPKWEKILEYLEGQPMATVATHSGNGDWGGHLTVIARNGKRVSERGIERHIEDAGRGNGVDGPALQWLLTQSEPRVWVTDQQWFGKYGVLPTEVLIATKLRAAQGRVKIIDNLGELKAA